MNGVRGDMNVESLLRKFKKICERTNVLAEVRNRRHFEKPSDIRRKKRKDAVRKYKMQRLEAEGIFVAKRRKPKFSKF